MLDRKLNLIIMETLGEQYVTGYPKEFSKRLVVQKMLYLLSHGKHNPKIKLYYDWSFYLRGPYSSEIASAIYHINNLKGELGNQKVELETSEKDAISKFKELRELFLELMTKHGVDSEIDTLESISTMVYFINQDATRDEIMPYFKKIKKELHNKLPHDFLIGLIDLLEEFGYF
jgi:uncharacterized protein YwgA